MVMLNSFPEKHIVVQKRRQATPLIWNIDIWLESANLAPSFILYPLAIISFI